MNLEIGTGLAPRTPVGGFLMQTGTMQSLYQNRNQTVAKSFYRQLKTEGFSHEQIIALSTTLLDLVTEDIRDTTRAEAK